MAHDEPIRPDDTPRFLHADRAVDRLLRLLAVPGPSGEEGPVRDAVLDELVGIGVPREAIREDDAPQRLDVPAAVGNLIALLPGTVPGPRRLLSAHMDTVPLARGARPRLRGDRIVAEGRTALDGVTFQTRPFYSGNPWFLAPSIQYFRWRDRLAG